MPKAEKYRLVLVEWEDSHGVSASWEYVSRCNPYVLICRSVGWLLHDGGECIVVVPHLTASDQAKQQGCGDMTIPRSAVRSIVG